MSPMPDSTPFEDSGATPAVKRCRRRSGGSVDGDSGRITPTTGAISGFAQREDGLQATAGESASEQGILMQARE